MTDYLIWLACGFASVFLWPVWHELFRSLICERSFRWSAPFAWFCQPSRIELILFPTAILGGQYSLAGAVALLGLTAVVLLWKIMWTWALAEDKPVWNLCRRVDSE
jgi:hypothetical protein